MENALSEKVWNNRDHRSKEEGPIAEKIESRTARIPSDVFLWAAVGTMAGSLTLRATGRKHGALFLGQWAAPLLILGLYNKLVKVAGHDQKDKQAAAENGKDEEITESAY